MNKRIRLLAILFGVLLGMFAGHFIFGKNYLQAYTESTLTTE